LRPLTEALIKVTTKANRHSSTGWEPFVGFVVRDFRRLVLIIRHDRISPGKWLWGPTFPRVETLILHFTANAKRLLQPKGIT